MCVDGLQENDVKITLWLSHPYRNKISHFTPPQRSKENIFLSWQAVIYRPCLLHTAPTFGVCSPGSFWAAGILFCSSSVSWGFPGWGGRVAAVCCSFAELWRELLLLGLAILWQHWGASERVCECVSDSSAGSQLWPSASELPAPPHQWQPILQLLRTISHHSALISISSEKRLNPFCFLSRFPIKWSLEHEFLGLLFSSNQSR